MNLVKEVVILSAMNAMSATSSCSRQGTPSVVMKVEDFDIDRASGGKLMHLGLLTQPVTPILPNALLHHIRLLIHSQEISQQDLLAPSSSKTAASAEYSAWTTTDTRIKPSITMIPDDLYMDDETTTR
ncbi:hypothetical protein Tco_0786581 [Tanacetum coccineum]